jgi:hypothetical protein
VAGDAGAGGSIGRFAEGVGGSSGREECAGDPTPENYAATVYEKLGIDRNQPLYTNTNRPVYFAHHAEPIAGV